MRNDDRVDTYVLAVLSCKLQCMAGVGKQSEASDRSVFESAYKHIVLSRHFGSATPGRREGRMC